MACTSDGAPFVTPPIGMAASLSPPLAVLALGSPYQDPGKRLAGAPAAGEGCGAACGLSAAYASGSRQCFRNGLYFSERRSGYGTLGGRTEFPHMLLQSPIMASCLGWCVVTAEPTLTVTAIVGPV